jgi:hypothetical protein
LSDGTYRPALQVVTLLLPTEDWKVDMVIVQKHLFFIICAETVKGFYNKTERYDVPVHEKIFPQFFSQ